MHFVNALLLALAAPVVTAQVVHKGELVFKPTKADYGAVQRLLEGKSTPLVLSTKGKTRLRKLYAQGFRLEKFGTSKMGTLTIDNGFWFTRKHRIEDSIILRIYTNKDKRLLSIEYPAG